MAGLFLIHCIFGFVQIFYAPKIDGDCVFIEGQENQHLKVLRKNIGDEIVVIDGKSSAYSVRIEKTLPQKTIGKILSPYQSDTLTLQSNYHLHLAVAPTKNMDRMEWMVEKTCELGIQQITFLITKHSERKTIKFDRLQKKALAATKQSKKAFLPQFQICTISEFLAQDFKGKCCIAHCQNGKKMIIQKMKWNPGEEITIMIGPEGDFTKDEIYLATKNKFEPVSLGLSRLRTETAAIYATSCVYAYFM